MGKYLLILFALVLFAGSLVVGVTVAGLTTQQQNADSIILGGSTFNVAIGGGGTLPLQAIGFRPGIAQEEPFTVTLDASPDITALTSVSLFTSDVSGFDGRLQGVLEINGQAIWGPDTLANFVSQSPIFLATLPGGGSVAPTLRVIWPNGTPAEDNPFQGATYAGDIVVDATQLVGATLDSCVDSEGLVTVVGPNSVNFSGGMVVPSWGDPACSSSRAFPRMTGIEMIYEVTSSNPGARFAVGLIAGADLINYEHVVLFDDTGLIHVGDQASVATLPVGGDPGVGSWTFGETYRVRVSLGYPTGVKYAIQGFGFAPLGGSSWSNLGASTLGSATTLSMAVSNFDQVLTVVFEEPSSPDISLAVAWAPFYSNRASILGSAGTMIPFGDEAVFGVPSAVTGNGLSTGASGLSPVWTPSEPLSAWDTAFDPTLPANLLNIAPVLTFNGIDEEMNTPDDDFWSPGNGVTDGPFSVGAWINLAASAGQRTILGRWAGAKEWNIVVAGNETLVLQLRDNSAGAGIAGLSAAPIAEGVWVFVVVTYDGTGGPTAADGITMYANGVSITNTASNHANYVAMENLSTSTDFGMESGSGLFSGAMLGGPFGPFFAQKELTPAEVTSLYDVERVGLGL